MTAAAVNPASPPGAPGRPGWPAKRRLLAWVGGLLLACHFALAGLGAAKVPVARALGHSLGARLVLVYAYMTGTGSYFGFFAPGVISQLRVDYELHQRGAVIGNGEFRSSNREISLRLHNLIQKFWTASKEPEYRRSLAASFASRKLADVPAADAVVITVRAFVLPSMAEYRSGMRPYWETAYVGTFERDPRPTAPGAVDHSDAGA